MWVGYAEGHPTGTQWVFNHKKKKIILTRDVTFLQKTYGEYIKVEKPVLVTMCYEGSGELKMVSIISSNNNYNVVSDSNSNTNMKNNNKNFLMKILMTMLK